MGSDGEMIKRLSEEFERICLDSAKKAFPLSKSDCEVNADSQITDSTGVGAPEKDNKVPIMKKFEDLSTKILDLKRQHISLSGQINDLNDTTANILAQPEVTTIVEHIGKENERLRRRYLKESSERKRLYNEVLEIKGNIRVFCRCRPLNQAESEDGLASVVEFDPSQDNELHINCSDSSKKQFKFDHVFKPEDDQEAVFAETKPVVTSVLDGYNVCIFAYGQTGTGKTFTMEGTPENRGVNYRTLEELFHISEDRSGIMRYELFVSMLEVYNEKIKDLLVENSDQPSKKLEIKQAAGGAQEVPGLIEARVFSTNEVWELLKYGCKARSVGSTSANELSSRSHCLLRVTVKGENLLDGQKTKSHLWLVDLAGSERVGRIDVEGERLKESQYINKSLSALGDVISALASKSAHIPYRNSKLTHMLQNSLGGDCKTLMIVQISPSSADSGETLCSLNFASRARGVENGPARKQSDVAELFKYKQMVEKLKHDEKESKKLQDSLQSTQLRLAAREHSCKCLQDKVRDLEMQLAEERKMRMKQENRTLTSVSSYAAQSSALPPRRQAAPLKSIPEKKPPLGPSKPRKPLRRITNFVPAPIPSSASFRGSPSGPSTDDKENQVKGDAAAAKSSFLRMPRRMSIVKPQSAATSTNFLPRRRVSIATLRPEPNETPLDTRNDNGAAKSSFLRMPRRMSIVKPQSAAASTNFLPRRRVSIATFRPEPNETPLDTRNDNGGSKQSILRNRKGRYSQLFSSRPDMLSDVGTPVSPMASSKFMGSPVSQQVVGYWKPKNPTVVAVQRKPLVWTPLKVRGLQKNATGSFMPVRS